jgi:hypothetical protein
LFGTVILGKNEEKFRRKSQGLTVSAK